MADKFKLNDPSLLIETGIINGKPAKSIAGTKPFEVRDPATDQVWAHAEAMDETDADAAIAVATEAFKEYSTFTARRRARLLLELERVFRAVKDDLAQLVVMESGKSLKEAEGEIDYAASYAWFMAGECERIQGETIKAGENPNMRFFTIRQPIGPVALLCPWNYPVVIALRKITTALAAGCTCVVKPSPETPITASVIATLCMKAGFPPGCVNVVTASHETTPAIGKKLCEDPRIKKISFTGSTNVGKLLASQCASTLKKMTLELGGNGGWVVFEDADLEAAAVALIANKFRASGQVCLCANRVFVQKGVVDKFSELMRTKMRAMKIGHGLADGVTNGPLTTKRGADRCVTLIEDAVKTGGKLVTGGKRVGPGYHFEPTLLVGASKESLVYREEMFGPICSIYPFDTEEEVLESVNGTPMGLTNYVYTKDIARAWRCYEKLESGTIAINTASANAAESPFGGMRDSGMGKEGGIGYGVEEFCTVKVAALTI